MWQGCRHSIGVSIEAGEEVVRERGLTSAGPLAVGVTHPRMGLAEVGDICTA